MVSDRQSLANRLRNPEVDDLGDGYPIVQRHQDIGRLDVAVDDPLLMRVLHRVADRNEQLQPLLGGQVVVVTVLRDGLRH